MTLPHEIIHQVVFCPLYNLTLKDRGGRLESEYSLRVRVSHQQNIKPGQRVAIAITTNHPLAAFAHRAGRQQDHGTG
ncbi:hypothetical protein [Haliea sp. E1-2-M8]|uniref:hypothetical protein n=1 Tax=Haliea sp. E1-2-M8 TaxID=3064706 RepID=UPI00272AAC7A|nr:hypothetical protein [Haliea sp. E1-2-M8]